MRLEDTIDIFAGHSYKTKVPEEPNSGIYALQMRDIKDGCINYKSMLCVEDLDYKKHFFLKEDDVLLIGKGLDFKTFMVKNFDKSKRIVVVNPIYILRCTDVMLPKYLHIYLSQSSVQKELISLGRGGRIKSLPISSLQNLNIITPSIDKQKKVIKIYELIEQQKDIANQIITQREQQLSETIINSEDIKKGIKHVSISAI